MNIFYFLLFGISAFSDFPERNMSCSFNKVEKEKLFFKTLNYRTHVAWGHAWEHSRFNRSRGSTAVLTEVVAKVQIVITDPQ